VSQVPKYSKGHYLSVD